MRTEMDTQEEVRYGVHWEITLEVSMHCGVQHGQDFDYF